MGERTSTLTAILKDAVSAPAERIKREFDGLRSSAGALGNVLQGIGQGIGMGIFNALTDAVRTLSNLIPDLVNRAFNFTNLVDELGDATGASAEETSRLIGTYQLLGISTDNLGTRMGQLSRVVVNNEATLARYGIATRDVNGNLLNQVQIVEQARQFLSRYESGTAKAAMMVKLFGRAGLDMADYLSLSDEQVRVVTGDLENLGVILDSDTARSAEAAKIEMRRFDLAMQGLGNTLLENILPALIPAISGVTNWVRDNARQIANFMAQVVNFVMGMIAALTGAEFSAVSFTDTLGEVGGAAVEAGSGLDDAATGADRAAGASKRATDALRDQIDHYDRMIDSVNRLDEAQERRFQKEMERLVGSVEGQISAIELADRQRGIEEQRASMLREIAAAEADLARVGTQTPLEASRATQAWADAQEALNEAIAEADPEAQARAQQKLDDLAMQSVQNDLDATAERAAAQQRLDDLRARSAEFERDQTDETRKAELASVRNYIEAIADAESEWASKKGLLEQLKKNEATLNSQIAAANEAGDLQRVADLTLQLEAVKAAERRAQMAAANEERTKEFEDQKTRLEGLVEAASKAGAGMGAGIKAGAITAGGAITDFTTTGTEGIGGLADAVNGEGGLTDAMEDARLAGEEFGATVKDAINTVIGVFQTLFGWVVAVTAKFDEVARSDVWKFLTEPVKLPFDDLLKDVGRNTPGPGDILRGHQEFFFGGGRAGGGPTAARGTYIVGEDGPELLNMGPNSGYVTPNGALGGTVVVEAGAIVINADRDPAATARALMQELKREASRQGMTLAPSTT